MMAPENYYLVLGVSRSESPAGIRARYRDLVRTLHPDVAGAQSTSAFQKIAQAYAVLADPSARQRHDAALAAWEEPLPVQEHADPLRPWQWRPVSLFAQPMAVRPSFDALIERLFRNFTGVGIPKAERPEALTFEVVVTPGEAVRGVEVPIAVPRIEPCRECGGAERVWLFPCAACVGQRIVITEHIVPISIPPPIHPESVIEMSLGELGLQNLYLRLYIRIQP